MQHLPHPSVLLRADLVIGYCASCDCKIADSDCLCIPCAKREIAEEEIEITEGYDPEEPSPMRGTR